MAGLGFFKLGFSNIDTPDDSVFPAFEIILHFYFLKSKHLNIKRK